MYRTKDFLGQKKSIVNYFKKKGVSYDTISEFSALSGIPILVICEFIKESLPEHAEICNIKIKQIKDFFQIKE